jgi:predicted nucleic acid-binding protein
MVIALFDTNVLIDYLNGIEAARDELNKYEERAISVITWMEVMVGATPTTENDTRIFLNSFVHVEIDDIVATRAVTLRRIHKMKLPNAIVWASAQTRSMLLVTRNTKDFPGNEPDVRVPYRL